MPAPAQNVALNWARKSPALLDALPVLHLLLRRAFPHRPSTHRPYISLVGAVHDDAAGAHFILPLPVASFFWGRHRGHAPAGRGEFDGQRLPFSPHHVADDVPPSCAWRPAENSPPTSPTEGGATSFWRPCQTENTAPQRSAQPWELLGVVVQQLVGEVGAGRHRLPDPGRPGQATPHRRGVCSAVRAKRLVQVALGNLPHPLHLGVKVAVAERPQLMRPSPPRGECQGPGARWRELRRSVVH
ncbi:uncharacterized protein Tco025E_08935 [Trypanosoma conorhini]|uniref:Uncharacterized protein n=1 Tax=Trypanosoma conorhini TaxID=83891 RepID=A0A3R7KR93_9TRYP|nr:uncharacterized protein Tco025E_08935 [Trypanosoma conorhini]RNE99757.1 hypothetical protein Tco025E_08935 [Trypanosoma conorhini]